jgi:hypothetical protein
MKCFYHPETDALAICIHCGAGVCTNCARRSAAQRITCSDECAKALSETESVLVNLRLKTLGGHRLTGYFCAGAGLVLGLFAGLSGAEGQWLLFSFQAALALGLLVSGIFYLRLANRNEVK